MLFWKQSDNGHTRHSWLRTVIPAALLRSWGFFSFCISLSSSSPTPFPLSQSTPGRPAWPRSPEGIFRSLRTSRRESVLAVFGTSGQAPPPGPRRTPSGSLVLPFSLTSLGLQNACPDKLLLLRGYPESEPLHALFPHPFSVPGLADSVSAHGLVLFGR